MLARLIALNAERAAEEQRSGAAAVAEACCGDAEDRPRGAQGECGHQRGVVLMEAATFSLARPRHRLPFAIGCRGPELDLVGPARAPAGGGRLPGWERPSNWY